MGLTPNELAQVPDLSHKEAYKRIKSYYQNFIKIWDKMNEDDKSKHIFGHGRTASVSYVSKSSDYLGKLPNTPSLNDSIDLATNVICKSLEYGYHDKDNHGIKMGAYAHFIINKFNGGKLN